MELLFHQFMDGLRATTWPEFMAVLTGIASVYFSRSANILVYPFGVISTAIYVYISFAGGLFAEAGLNIYYVIMNLAGWYMWSRRTDTGEKVLHITTSNGRDWQQTLLFFGGMWLALWLLLRKFTTSTVPLEDALASASAYTGMFLMNKKKMENWIWWIITNIVSIPLYFIKGYVFTSVQFIIFLALAISGWIVWYRKWKQENLMA
ncbi:nicotinamide mononucleotide transporter [Filimonas lacunae]|uniref:Nicotinamide riboside transporter PnuC n=1 Tax=Filimonas lacunae TaxID=477680 RepID=A0A173MQN8_9BACT|nr:nicotinamide riboside transporter PnuC [Filimonas lacunae]BAV09759.1 ribosyl nicotinamide transporter, PnuC-like [Filimonas lacunae]SIS78569.1 nicotinamide mononucleotide transporter [Filimonas lacunae]